MGSPAGPMVVQTSAGDFPLRECRLSVGGREWTVVHTGAVLTPADEAIYFADLAGRLPYGVVLWPAAIALAHEVATRADAFRGRRVLELGAGRAGPGGRPVPVGQPGPARGAGARRLAGDDGEMDGGGGGGPAGRRGVRTEPAVRAAK